MIHLADGFYANSQFFLSSKKYTALKNSNVWTAKALKEAAFDINPSIYLTEKLVMRKVYKLKSAH